MKEKTTEKLPLLEIEHLKKYFPIPGKGDLHAVDDISLKIMPHETLGLVGESGCGKSTVGNVLMQLLSPTDGTVKLEGKDIFAAKGKEQLALRRQMQMIFQDPYSSLNPKKTIKKILAEPFQIHGLLKGKELDKKIYEMAEIYCLR